MKKRLQKICKLAFDKETYKSFGKGYAELLYQRSLEDDTLNMFENISDEDFVQIIKEEYEAILFNKKLDVFSANNLLTPSVIIERLDAIENNKTSHSIGAGFMAQYDYDMVKEENEKLKGEIEEFKRGFIELRQQFSNMKFFNEKLTHLNKLFLSTKIFTIEEKLKICEDFDSVTDKEELKILYNLYLNKV